jgi:hypothetical protein
MSKFDLLPPLPPVLKPEAEQKKEELEEVKEEGLNEVMDASKRFLIVCSRDLSAEDEAIFKQHGKTLRWKKESFLNLPFEQLDFDFLFIDAREKEARLTLGRQNLALYHQVAYVYAIQKGVDDFLSEMDTVDISSIPQHAINGKDFRHQLLNQKLSAPSLAKSVFRFFVGCFAR